MKTTKFPIPIEAEIPIGIHKCYKFIGTDWVSAERLQTGGRTLHSRYLWT